MIHVKDEDRRGEIQTELNQKRLQIRAIKQCLDDVDARAETTTTYINGFADDEQSENGADILAAVGDGEDGDSYDDDDDDDDENENDDSDMPRDDSSSVFFSQQPQLFPPMGERDTDVGDENNEPTSGDGKPSGSTSDPFISTGAAAPTGDSETSTVRKRRQSEKAFSISPNQPFLRIPESTTAAIATGTATGTAPTSQPTPSTKPTSHFDTADSKTQDTEASLSQARAEQESLTSSLLTLAGQLKSSSQSFQNTLESEKTVLARAVEGLDRNITGMDAAGRRMGMLRRMTEGRGWWGRIMIYFWIAVLWVALLLIMFLMPKLRF